MRSVVLYQLLSLDGVAEEPGNWMFDGSPAIFDNLGRVIDDQDAVLLGRGTYEYWVDHWPTSTMEPFATFINATPKYVFSSTELTKPWNNTTRVEGPAAEHVADLKRQDGGAIGIHGSIDLARSLLRAGLVDEFRFVVAPTLAGYGRRLFDDGLPPQNLELLEVDRSPGGSLLLHFRVTETPDGT